jgi:hypothetical protein
VAVQIDEHGLKVTLINRGVKKQREVKKSLDHEEYREKAKGGGWSLIAAIPCDSTEQATSLHDSVGVRGWNPR